MTDAPASAKNWYDINLADPATGAAALGIAALGGAGIKWLVDEFQSGRLKFPVFQQQAAPVQQPPPEAAPPQKEAPKLPPVEKQEYTRFSSLGGDNAGLDRSNSIRMPFGSTPQPNGNGHPQQEISPFGRRIRSMNSSTR